jgi:hypothetical protein
MQPTLSTTPNSAIPAAIRKKPIATDPPVSEAQRRAMFAAAAGNSTLGIPKKVGEEFVGKDEESQDADSKTLYVNRPLTNAADVIAWAKKAGFKTTLPADDMHVTLAFSRDPVDWSKLDAEKEIATVDAGPSRALVRLGDKGAIVLRFDSPAMTKRWQQFRDVGASWDFPGYKPHLTITYDAGDIDLAGIKPYDGLLEFGSEVFAEVDDDWADKVKAKLTATDSVLALALDRDSVREKDRNGRLTVKVANISKATVNPYRGKEIPHWETLGLDPDKIYQLLRDPEELQKAAPTFNGVQLLRKHTPVDAQDHKPWDVVGTTGTDAKFEPPYLTNSLHVWSQEAIDDIEGGDKKELSCGYNYDPDMTPGTYEGLQFDGVMRAICGNHVALVKDGRAGPDVVVGDSAEEIQWAALENALLDLSHP